MLAARVLAFCLCLPGLALAEDAPLLAEYWARSGSLPPQYAWSTSVTIRADGQLVLKHCKGYDSEGPACTLQTARVTEAALKAIAIAARAAGLSEKPAQEASEFPVGGGTVSGRVTLDGKAIDLPAFPEKADERRVVSVLTAISDAIPPNLFDGD